MKKNKNILKLLECLEKYNNQYVVQKLLFYKNKQNQTALQLAIDKEQAEVALALINKLEIKDLNIKEKEDIFTTLHLAIEKKVTAVALTLINKLDARDLSAQTKVDGLTALHFALIRKEKEVAYQLIAKLSVKDLSVQTRVEGLTALHMAIQKKQTKAALALINKIDVKNLSMQRKDGFTALHLAIMTNQMAIALVLIDKLNVKDLSIQTKLEGLTPLHFAIDEEQNKVALTLINKLDAKNLSIQTKLEGFTALHLAIVREQQEISLALIDKLDVKDLSIQTKLDGHTALHIAIDNVKKEVSLALIDKLDVKDLSIQTKLDGHTALHIAIDNRKKEIALALIDKVDTKYLSIQRKDGHTALHLALIRKQQELALALINKKIDTNAFSIETINFQEVAAMNETCSVEAQKSELETSSASSKLSEQKEHHNYNNLNLKNPWFSDNISHKQMNTVSKNNEQDNHQYLKSKKEKKIPKFQQATKKKESITKIKKTISSNLGLSTSSFLSSSSWNDKKVLKPITNQHNLTAINNYLKTQEKIEKQQEKSKKNQNTKDDEKKDFQNLLLSDYIESTIGLEQREFDEQFLLIQIILTQKKENQINDQDFNEKIREKIKENDKKQCAFKDFESQKIKKVGQSIDENSGNNSIPIMILIRNQEWDHEKGRPSLVLAEYEDQMLILPGTTKEKIKWLDQCYQEQLNGQVTYFYFKNLTKVNRSNLKGVWKHYSFVKEIDNDTLLNQVLEYTNLEKINSNLFECENTNQDGMSEYFEQLPLAVNVDDSCKKSKECIFKMEDIKEEENRLQAEVKLNQQETINHNKNLRDQL